eukprot:s103_g14.t1
MPQSPLSDWPSFLKKGDMPMGSTEFLNRVSNYFWISPLCIRKSLTKAEPIDPYPTGTSEAIHTACPRRTTCVTCRCRRNLRQVTFGDMPLLNLRKEQSSLPQILELKKNPEEVPSAGQLYEEGSKDAGFVCPERHHIIASI